MKHIRFCLFFALIFLTVPSFLKTVRAQTTFDPQYVFVHKNPFSTDTCCRFDEGYPSTINQAGFDEIINEVGTKGTTNRKLGIGMTFSYLRVSNDNLIASLNNLLNLAVVNDVPVLIRLDGFEFLDAHPELYNWWDPNMPCREVSPCFNENNINNVEWTGWNPAANPPQGEALKISWRNWGVQSRVNPHPNIASPAFINLSKQQLQLLVPIIVSWYHNLPADKKYLFGGIVAGWEINIGFNYYYFPNGNSYLNQLPANDPQLPPGGISGNPNQMNATQQLGYAAVKTAGIKSSGTLTPSDFDTVIQRYLTEMTKTIYDLGIPRDRIFTQTNVYEDPIYSGLTIVRSTANAAITNYSQPGWSFYTECDLNPGGNWCNSGYPYLHKFDIVLDQINNTQWGTVEWLYVDTRGQYGEWYWSMTNSLNYRSNKMLNIHNWEGELHNNPVRISALHQILSENPSCWVTPATLNPVTYDGQTATFSWTPGENGATQYLLITNHPDLLPSGIFQTINIYNGPVTGTSLQRNLGPGTYYWTVVNDGCNLQQRRVASATKFILAAAPTFTPTPSPTSAPSHCQPLGDVDCSGQVNSFDFTMLISKFGNVPAGTPEDLDDSLTVNSGDLTILLLNFGNLLSTPTPTPTSICAPVGDNCKTNDNCCSLLCLNNTCAVIVPQ